MIIKSGKNYKFPIHDDTPNKLLSGVIYLYPEKNTGTLFYSDKKGSEKEIIDWKPNRAVFFSRVERKTWHSFEGDGKSDRIVLVYNLVAKDLRKVFKVEGTNFLIGKTPYKKHPQFPDMSNIYTPIKELDKIVVHTVGLERFFNFKRKKDW